MKTLMINWIGSCENCCGDKPKKVETEKGTENWLWDDDLVTCTECGHQGVIACYDEVATVSWNEIEQSKGE